MQQLIPRVPPRLLARLLDGMQSKRFVDWSFGHYLQIAPPEFATEQESRPGTRPPRPAWLPAAPERGALGSRGRRYLGPPVGLDD